MDSELRVPIRLLVLGSDLANVEPSLRTFDQAILAIRADVVGTSQRVSGVSSLGPVMLSYLRPRKLCSAGGQSLNWDALEAELKSQDHRQWHRSPKTSRLAEENWGSGRDMIGHGVGTQ